MCAQIGRQEMLQQVLDGCRRKYKFNKRRLSYSHPLFRELFDAFSSLENNSDGTEMRRKIWTGVAKQVREEMELGTGYFEQLRITDEDLNEQDILQIKKDLERSGLLWNEIGDRSQWLVRLERVLRSYVAHDRVHGYTQGMNLFASEFLLVTESEETAFWLVLHVCESITPEYHTKDMVGLKRDIWVLKQLLEQFFPDLVTHFKTCGMDNSFTFIFIGPLLSLFASVLPQQSLDSLYDVLLANGVTTIFAAWLSFFKINQLSLMEQKDANGVMDALNLALESWGTQPNFQRSLLQWCVVLDTGSITDIRQNAPMHWLNMDALVNLAQEHPIRASSQRVPLRDQSSSFHSAVVLSPRMRRRKTTLGEKSVDTKKSSRSNGGPYFEPSSVVSQAAEKGSPVVLTVVWIAFNLRNPFNCHAVEEYRQASVNCCRDILKASGYEDILNTQRTDTMTGHAASVSTLLPTATNLKKLGLVVPGGLMELSPSDSEMLTDTEEEEEEEEEEEYEEEVEDRTGMNGSSTLPSLQIPGRSKPKPLQFVMASPGTQKKQLVIETKQDLEAFSDSTQTSQLWRVPESFSSTEALLDGLLNASSDLLHAVPDHDLVHPLLDRLWLCLKTTRECLPVTHHAEALLEELMQNLSENAPAKMHWRKKLANVFRSSKKGGSSGNTKSSSPTSSTLSSEGKNSGNVSSPNTSGHMQSTAGPTTATTSSRKQRKLEKARQRWRMNLVVLLLACKADAENKSIGLYEALNPYVATKISSLLSFVQVEIRRLIHGALNRNPTELTTSSSSQSSTNSTSVESEVDGGDLTQRLLPSETFFALLNYQLRVWAVDGSATLYSEQWIRARKADLRSAFKALDSSAHRRISSSTGVEPVSRRNAMPTPPPLPPRPKGYDKTRSKSAPIDLNGLPSQPHLVSDEIKLARHGTHVGLMVAGLSHYEVRKKSLLASQEHRALYWALRSNYHIALEMSKLADMLPGSELGEGIRELASVLHSTTYEYQADLCESVRIEYITAQLETFQTMVQSECKVSSPPLPPKQSPEPSPKNGALSATTAQVLLDDLEDQIKLVKSPVWKTYFEDQFETIEGDLIL